MSLCGSFLSDEQFQCSICLDVFTNPSSTPCGHSFCMGCISRYWDGSKICQCPLCKKTFQKRPDLHINRTLREITEQFRSMTGGVGGGGGDGGLREKRGGRGGGKVAGMPSDLLVELTRKIPRPLTQNSDAMACEGQGESFTSNLASSVPNQSPISAMAAGSALLPPPPPLSRSAGRRRFTVSGAASSQNLPLCDLHHRGIMIYCRTDRVCVCPECVSEEHQGHDTVAIETQWRENMDQLRVTELEIQEMIRQRLRKIEEIRMSVTEVELAVERETAGSLCMFSELMAAVERSQAELMEVMEMSRRAAEHQADAMVRQLELEVEELRRREGALVELARSDDQAHCVRTFPLVSSPLPAKDWTAVGLTSDLGTGTVYRSLLAQVERFQERLRSTLEIALTVEPSPSRSQPSECRSLEGRTLQQCETAPRLCSVPEMRRVQEYAVDVTLDSNTAHPRLILSEDMKSVRCGDRHQLLPDNVERFDRVVCVLGREAISGGRHYWEVQVGGKTDWDLGVARQSINRKGKVDVTPSNGYWFLSLRDKNKYAFRTEPSTDVHLSLRPNKIGVFVDFERGQVSFYNVDAKIHIYTFHDTFAERVLPFFSPCTNKSGKNDGALVITPVGSAD